MGYGEILQPDMFELQQTAGEFDLPESSGKFYPQEPYEAFIADREAGLPAAYARQERDLHEARAEVHAFHRAEQPDIRTEITARSPPVETEPSLNAEIVAKIGPIDAEKAKLEKPNPFYPYKLAKGLSSAISIFSKNRFLSHTVEAGHRLTSGFRTRRSERSFGLNHIQEDLVDKPVRAIRRKEMIGRLEDKRIRVLKALIPTASHEQISKAVDRTSEISKGIIRTARKRLHLPITMARIKGTHQSSNVIAQELHEIGALEDEDERFAIAA